VGMRKVLGARRGRLVVQFLSESMIFSLVAFLLGLGLICLALPLFNGLSGGELVFRLGPNLALLSGLILTVGIISGLYPALLLSSFLPSRMFRGVLKKGKSGLVTRRILIVFQYAVTVVLLVSTVVVTQQRTFMRSRHFDLKKEEIISVRVRDENVIQAYESIRTEWLQNPHVLNVSASSSLPGTSFAQRAYIPEGFEDNPLMVLTLSCDFCFIDTLGLTITDGRKFSSDYTTDTLRAYIVNEAAVRRFGWTEPVGRTLICRNSDEEEAGTAEGRVIGVVKNFHFQSLHREIEPLLMRVDPRRLNLFNIRVKTVDIPKVLNFLEKDMKRLQPAQPFQYWFLDSLHEGLYRSEQRLAGIFKALTVITILIACLGLFGLMAYLTEQRTREIGIRRVLGASVSRIVAILSWEYLSWIALSNLIAWPVAYLVMHRWLWNFPYRVSISPFILLFCGGAAIVVAAGTVSVQTVRAARRNPAEAIRHE